MKHSYKRLVLIALSIMLLIPAFAATAGAAAPTSKSPAADLRIAFGQLLGEHAMLAMIAMQKGLDGKADFANAAAALNTNTEALTGAMTSLLGAEAGKAFNGMWKQHIGFFVDYVKATGAKDEAGKKAALKELAQYRDDFAAFLSGATKIPASALADALQMHVDQLVSAFDSYAAKDYEASYKYFRQAYAHMFKTGDALSGAIIKQYPEKFNNTTANTPAADLRLTLGRLLGEHSTLAVIAMQKGIDGAPDFGAAAGALGANTADLTAAITSVFGADAGKAFNGMWRQHIGFFVNYVTATAGKDEAGRQEALKKLSGYKEDFAAFLSGATKIPASALAQGLQMHVNQLVSAFDKYVAKDYKAAYDNVLASYKHMYGTGNALAEAIVGQYPDKFHGAAHNMDMGTAAQAKVWLKIGSKQLKIGDKTASFEVSPFVKKGVTFISLRNLAETVGAKVTWDSKTGTVWVIAGENKATFWIGESYMEWNGMRKEVGAELFIKSGRTQVPLRFIAELFGWDVSYQKSDWSITLTK